MTQARKSLWIFIPLGLLTGLAVIVSSFFVYRPDRPVDTLVPGSSADAAFVVQIIRPRLGLPLGGVLPPRLFGLEEHLGFTSTSPGASLAGAGTGRFELGANGWDLIIALDAARQVTPETRVLFELIFEDQLRRVRCRPADPAVGTVSTTELAGSSRLSGSFNVELAHCEDAATGEPLGWPPKPLILHGSFDQLPPGSP